jgi:hypothetical protein
MVFLLSNAADAAMNSEQELQTEIRTAGNRKTPKPKRWGWVESD